MTSFVSLFTLGGKGIDTCESDALTSFVSLFTLGGTGIDTCESDALTSFVSLFTLGGTGIGVEKAFGVTFRSGFLVIPSSTIFCLKILVTSLFCEIFVTFESI